MFVTGFAGNTAAALGTNHGTTPLAGNITGAELFATHMTAVPHGSHAAAGVATDDIASLVTDRFTGAGAAAIHPAIVETVGVALGHIGTIDRAVVVADTVALDHAAAIDRTAIGFPTIDVAKVLVAAGAVAVVAVSIVRPAAEYRNRGQSNNDWTVMESS